MPQLNFTMQHQLQDNWCWAATSASTSLFYDHSTPWTQCKVANSALTRNDCCLNLNPNPCDVPWYLDKALSVTGNFASYLPNALSINDISTQIDAGTVIGVRVGWSNGDGHFVVIYGYDASNPDPFVYIADPIYPTSYLELSTFTSEYQGTGTWTDTYYTKSTAAGGMIQFSQIQDHLTSRANQVRLAISKAQKTPTAALVYPHDIYLVDYTSLLNDQPVLKKTGYRVMDNEEQSRLIYDFSSSAVDAKLHRIVNDRNYIDHYAAEVEKLVQDQATIPKNVSLSLVKCPELKIEALWLHASENPQQGNYIPVISPSFLTHDSVYDAASFLSRLIAAAKEKKPATDHLIGG
jgi:hypothetical protein